MNSLICKRGILAVVLALSACGDDDGDESGGNGPTGSGDDGGSGSGSGSGSATDVADDAPPPATDSSDSDTDATTGPLVPVMCEGVECAPGEICVAPGVDCDYGPCDADPPGEAEFFTAPRFCSPVPRGCEPDDETCLATELCTDSIDIPPLTDGVLLCPPVAEDCFCEA